MGPSPAPARKRARHWSEDQSVQGALLATIRRRSGRSAAATDGSGPGEPGGNETTGANRRRTQKRKLNSVSDSRQSSLFSPLRLKALMAAMRAGLCFAAALTPGSLFSDGRAAEAEKKSPPNIVYILCDDLGYGDVRCLNPNGKIPTPNVDSLAASGMIFADARRLPAWMDPGWFARDNVRGAMLCPQRRIGQGDMGWSASKSVRFRSRC